MKTLSTFFILFSAAILIASCAKKTTPSPQSVSPTTGTTTGTGTTSTGTVDVYVAGTYSNLTTELHGQACYWKNGTLVLLPSPTSPSQALSVTVLGSDIYVSGLYGYPETPALWKNGVLIPTSGGSLGGVWGQRATCMDVSNNTLYVGIDTYTYTNIATTASYLAITGTQSVESGLPDGNNQPMVKSICASGSKTYSVGTGYITFTSSFTAAIPVYWVNSIEQPFSFPADFNAIYRFGAAYGVTVSGSDVYAVGEVNSSNDPNGASVGSAPVVWKNNVATNLSETSPGIWTGGAATGIAISDNNVYIAGFLAQINGHEPVLWKNGVMTQLPQHLNNGSPSGIAVNGSDVYICGNEAGSAATIPCYWKNGTETLLTDGTSSSTANGILVVQN